MEISKVLESVQWAKRLFLDYNNKIESIIQQIKECFETYNSQGEAKTVNSLFDENGIRYSIMTRGVERHLTVLRMDYFDNDLPPYLIYLFYFNNNTKKTSEWDGWIYSNDKILETIQKGENAKIIDYSTPPSVHTVFGYFAVPVADFLGKDEIKEKTKEAVTWFQDKIYERFNKSIDFKSTNYYSNI